MSMCEGFGDWMKCLRCSLISSRLCPLEAENVMEALRARLKGEGMDLGYINEGEV